MEGKTLAEVIAIVDELTVLVLMRKTIAEVVGLRMCIPAVVRKLGLNPEQIIAFCNATPDGEELCSDFMERRTNEAPTRFYDFAAFVIEVLSGTDHPVESV